MISKAEKLLGVKPQNTATQQKEDTEHFNAAVPREPREKLYSLAKAAEKDWISGQCPCESYGMADTTAIYGYHVSGFIPSQLGGYEVTELYRYDIDPSYHFTKAQAEDSLKNEKYMYECFAREYEEELGKAGITETEGLCYHDLGAHPDLQRKFEDYERDWWEPALLRLELWVNDSEGKTGLLYDDDSRKPESVYCRVSINYSDAPYYRTKSDDTLFEFNMTVEQTLRMTEENFIRMLDAKMKDVK